MSTWDNADLLARCQRLANRPATDELMTDAKWYALLTEAQAQWMGTIAAICPETNFSAPELLTSADSGATYTFASYPIGHVEIRSARNGNLLVVGPEWDANTDFAQEGQTLRVPNGKTRTFSGGPYARYVKVPDVIDASTQPTMKPAHARMLLVYNALVRFCGITQQDPTFWLMMEQHAWSGDPNNPGDTGILGQLKTQFYASGLSAAPRAYVWYQSPDLGSN